MSVKLRLKEIRKSRKLTQAQVAEVVSCSVATYSRYESGSRQPSVDTLVMLADFFGVSTDYLCGRVPPDSSALSSSEIDMINAYRAVPDLVKEDVVEFLTLRKSKKRARKL